MRIVIAGDSFWHSPRLVEGVMKWLVARYADRIVIVLGDEPRMEEAVSRVCKGMRIATETPGASRATANFIRLSLRPAPIAELWWRRVALAFACILAPGSGPR